MNDLIVNDNEIKNMIHEIRGKQVMLDSDLAKLYGVETKRINEAVKNNPDKFPEKFVYVLTNDEYSNLRSKISTSSLERNYGGRRYKPRIFTEQGIYMLATILKSKIATQVTISIMDAFVAMRHFIGNNLINQTNINNMVLKHDNEIKTLQDTFNNFIKPEEKNKIFFKGQIYDAYSLLLDIFNKSKKEIIIIDNYADNVEVKNIDNILDRFIIIDRKVLYHSGSSFKDIGKSCFAISKIEEKNLLKSLLIELEI